jgi:rare lipoprotein A
MEVLVDRTMANSDVGKYPCALEKSFPLRIKRLPFLFLLIFSFAGCAERQVAKMGPPPEKRLLVLPSPGKYSKLNPYEIHGVMYYPIADAEGFVQFGKASWYGEEFHGRPTANGEIYDMYQVSAAHKTLPIGTVVNVVNLTNGKELVMRINDRGPFVEGRIIDLSYAAAKEIGLVGPGVAEVKVVALGKEVGKLKSPTGMKTVVEVENLQSGGFTVQVGAFRERARALGVADRLKVLFDYVDVAIHEGAGKEAYYRVRVSKSKSATQAGEVERQLKEMGFTGAFVVRL